MDDEGYPISYNTEKKGKTSFNYKKLKFRKVIRPGAQALFT